MSRTIFIVSTLLGVEGSLLCRMVDYRASSALKTVPQLAGVHWGCAFRLLLSVQVSQTIRRVVRLSLVDVCVRYHHRRKLILTTSLWIVGGVGVVRLLSTVNVHILWVFESIWVLGNLEDWLGLRVWLVSSSTSRLAWFLRSSPRLSCRVCGRINHESILWDILYHGMSSYHLSIILPLHLYLLKLLLKLYLLLLLRRESLSLIAITCRLWSNLLHQTAVLTLLQLVIWITILPREKSALSLALSSIYNSSCLRSRALTFSEMYNTFKTIRIGHILLVVVLLLLV